MFLYFIVSDHRCTGKDTEVIPGDLDRGHSVDTISLMLWMLWEEKNGGISRVGRAWSNSHVSLINSSRFRAADVVTFLMLKMATFKVVLHFSTPTQEILFWKIKEKVVGVAIGLVELYKCIDKPTKFAYFRLVLQAASGPGAASSWVSTVCSGACSRVFQGASACVTSLYLSTELRTFSHSYLISRLRWQDLKRCMLGMEQ